MAISDIDKEDPFTLIETGNELEENRDFWGAADYFLQASHVLKRQSKDFRNSSSTDDKERKIAALYQDQSIEYLHHARKSMIAAIGEEYEKDMNHSKDLPSAVDLVSMGKDLDMSMFEPFMASLSSADLIRRKKLLHALFLSEDKEEIEAEFKMPSEPENNMVEIHEAKTLSLEERLAQLNSSLPPQQMPTTDEERLKKINAGLGNLGVFVPPSYQDATSHSELLQGNTMSNEDQINEIMDMAKDEAMLDSRTKSTDVNYDDGSENNDVMEILKKAKIRIDLPYDDVGTFGEFRSIRDHNYATLSKNVEKLRIQCNDEDESSSDTKIEEDKEMEFWKNAASSDEGSNSEFDEMKRYLEQAQQLLLQASVSIGEYESLMNDDNVSNSNIVNKKNDIGEEHDGSPDEDNRNIDDNDEDKDDFSSNIVGPDVKAEDDTEEKDSNKGQDENDDNEEEEEIIRNVVNIEGNETCKGQYENNDNSESHNKDNRNIDGDNEEEKDIEVNISSNIVETDVKSDDDVQEVGICEGQVDDKHSDAESTSDQDIPISTKRDEEWSAQGNNVDGGIAPEPQLPRKSAILKMGKDGLEETQQILEKVMKLWPK